MAQPRDLLDEPHLALRPALAAGQMKQRGDGRKQNKGENEQQTGQARCLCHSVGGD